MKRIVFIIVVLLLSEVTFSQVYTNNESPVGMEHNMLFNANTRSRFQVTQTGSALLSLDYLFDGKFIPSYTSTAPTVSTPTVILIEGLVNWHSQRGAWVGWSTRYWQARRFKIEGFNVYQENAWKTIADYSTQDYTGGTKFITKVPAGSYTKLRFTFYEATGQDGNLGVSELFYLHPEAVRPYEGLLNATNDTWAKNGNDILYNKGRVDISIPATSFEAFLKLKVADTSEDYLLINNATGANGQFIPNIVGRHVSDSRQALYLSGHIKEENDQGNTPIMTFDSRIEGKPAMIRPLFGWDTHGQRKMTLGAGGSLGIGTTTTGNHKLAVEGSIGARKIKVEATGWSDFVFEKEYKLPTLTQVENHIKEKGHLKDIPSAEEVKREGFFLGEMDAKLLQKIEELTLYTIQQEKQLKKQSKSIEKLEALVEKLLESKKQNTTK